MSDEFAPIFTIRKLNDNIFMDVTDVASRNNTFTASIIVEKGEYELKIKPENVSLGDYVIKAWVTDNL